MVAMLSSCSVFQRSSRSIYANPEVSATITAADLVVSPVKVFGDTEGMSQSSSLRGTKKECESYAIAVALEKVGADVLVEPRFTYKYTNGKLKKVTVSGYPATYKDFRKANRADLCPMFPEQPKCCCEKGHKKECKK